MPLPQSICGICLTEDQLVPVFQFYYYTSTYSIGERLYWLSQARFHKGDLEYMKKKYQERSFYHASQPQN